MKVTLSTVLFQKRFVLTCILSLFFVFSGSPEQPSVSALVETDLLSANTVWAQETSEADIQWFKNEMRISSKYLEREQGIWGMSWAHFFTMFLLVVFFLATLVAMYIRSKRTQGILRALMKEEKEE